MIPLESMQTVRQMTLAAGYYFHSAPCLVRINEQRGPKAMLLTQLRTQIANAVADRDFDFWLVNNHRPQTYLELSNFKRCPLAALILDSGSMIDLIYRIPNSKYTE